MKLTLKEIVDLYRKPFDPTTDDGAKRMAVDIALNSLSLIEASVLCTMIFYIDRKGESKLSERVHKLEQKVDQLQK